MGLLGAPMPWQALPRMEEEEMRTPELIAQQLKERVAELEAEAEKPARKYPCKECTHYAGYRWKYLKQGEQCGNVLVKGFSKEYPWAQDEAERQSTITNRLCGPEKALWEPRLPWWRKLWNWFLAPWKEQ